MTGMLSQLITAAADAHVVEDSVVTRFWIAMLVNTVYFTGLAQAGVVLSAIYRTARSKWSCGSERIGFNGLYWLPLSVVLVGIIGVFGANHLYPWAIDPHLLHGAKATWLSKGFLFGRDMAILGALAGLSWYYFSVYKSPRSERRWEVMARVAPILILAYAVLWTLLAFDLFMSLEPHWYSNLFGGYIFVGNIYLAWAVMAIIAAFHFRKQGFTKGLSIDAFHDIGKMLFAFCAVTMYFLWSQVFVQWYGNLPEDIPYIIKRTAMDQWGLVGVVVLAVALIIPFVVLLSRKIKRTPFGLFSIACVALVGMQIERYYLVTPSVLPHPEQFFTSIELIVSIAFTAVYIGLAYLFIQRHPIEDAHQDLHP